MEPGHGGPSSFEIVREFLESHQGVKARPEELMRVRPALDDLIAKLTRLHRLYPECAAAKLSDEVLDLYRQAHGQDGLWRSAASLL